jgi:hypothetical protein
MILIDSTGLVAAQGQINRRPDGVWVAGTTLLPPDMTLIDAPPPGPGLWRWVGDQVVAVPPPPPDVTALQSAIVTATQQRLDAFARTRNYDGILSLCTYATSTVQKFQAEGQYGVNARDATWATLYDILSQVQAGTRPVPDGYGDIEPELPALAWPA